MKENQKELLQNCQDIVHFSKPEDKYQHSEKRRNRIENREVSVYNNGKLFIEDDIWKEYISSIICVERKTSIFSTKEKEYRDREEKAIYVANYTLDAEQANCLIRRHWYIENKDHYVRDATLKEDESRIRVNPENMSSMRSFALNILRKNKVENIGSGKKVGD